MIPPFELGEYFPARLIQARPAAAEQARLLVAPPAGFPAAHGRPGQFCRMRVTAADGSRAEAIFAMQSPPGDDTVRFLVRVGNPDGGEAADALSALADGAPIEMTLPGGSGFGLAEARGRDLLLVATGTGIAPVCAVLDVVLREREAFGALTLIHGLRSEGHVAIEAELARWTAAGLRARLCFSSVDGAGALRGETVQDALREEAADLSETAVVAVGQAEMLASLRADVLALGGDPRLFLTNL